MITDEPWYKRLRSLIGHPKCPKRVSEDLTVCLTKVQVWEGVGDAALRVALDESLKLQAHYATLLNQYDGGERKIFGSADAWIARLKETGDLK